MHAIAYLVQGSAASRVRSVDKYTATRGAQPHWCLETMMKLKLLEGFRGASCFVLFHSPRGTRAHLCDEGGSRPEQSFCSPLANLNILIADVHHRQKCQNFRFQLSELEGALR